MRMMQNIVPNCRCGQDPVVTDDDSAVKQAYRCLIKESTRFSSARQFVSALEACGFLEESFMCCLRVSRYPSCS